MMCGCFGFVSNGGPLDLDLLEQVAIDTESRGVHAHGLAWINSDGRLRQHRAPGRISRNMDCLANANDARILIGHCRLATAGSPAANINNHPHPCDGGWIVHNGVVGNNRELLHRWELAPSSDCDSETIAQLIETIDGETLIERTQAAINQLSTPAVVLGVWTRPARVMIARQGRPLHIANDREGNIYFASLPRALDAARRIRDNTVRIMEYRSGELVQTIRELKPCLRTESDPVLGRRPRSYQLDLNASRVPVWSE